MIVPYLQEKIECLVHSGRNPAISTRAQLAKQLGISSSNIANWIHGTTDSPPNHVPQHQIRRLCDLFAVDYLRFVANEDLDKFETSLSDDASGWVSLLKSSHVNREALQIERCVDASGAAMRGIGYLRKAVTDEVETIRMNERFRVHIRAAVGSQLILLLKEPNDVLCIDPQTVSRSGSFAATVPDFTVPDPEFQPFFGTTPLGPHCFLAVLSQTAWLPELMVGLLSPEAALRATTLLSLSRIVKRKITQKEPGLQVMRYPFDVAA